MTTEILDLAGNSHLIDFEEDPLDIDNEEKTKTIISNDLVIDRSLFDIKILDDHIKIVNNDIGEHLCMYPELINFYKRLEPGDEDKLLFTANFEKVKLGVLMGVDVNKFHRDVTPLLRSIIDDNEDSLQIVQLLIDNGADVNKSNYYGHRPILVAVRKDTKILELLLKNGGNPNFYDCDGNSPLYEAYIDYDDEAIRILYKYNVDPHTRHCIDFKEF